MEALGIDIKLLTAQLINFLLFTYIFMKFLNKPFKKYLSQQRKEEKERDRLLSELQTKEASMEAEKKRILDEARSQVSDILKEAEDKATAKKKDIVAAAQAEASAMKKKAQEDIESEREKMYSDLRSKVVRTSEAMTEKVMKDFLSDKTQKDVIKHLFTKLKSTKVYEN